MNPVSTKLENGVILIREPIASVKTAAVGFWFYTGSRLETPSVRGVTHFTEHMLFKGTKNRSAFDIACAFDRMGGYINAYTEREDVCMYCVVPSSKLNDALEIMCDMAVNAVFSGEEMEHEREVIESEILSSEDDPEDKALDAVENTVWPHQMVSASIGGTVKQVDSLTREHLAAWYEKHFVHGPMCACVAGTFDEKSVIEKIAALPVHSELPCENADIALAAQYKEQTPVWHKGVSFIKSKFTQEQIFLLYPIKLPVGEKAYYTLAVLNALAGDTMSSRLFQALREKGGWCYSVYSFYSFYADAACWCAYASSSKESCGRVTEELTSEMKKLFTRGVTEAEVDAAREHLCGEELIADSDIENRMKFLERCYDSGYGYKTTDERIALMRSITKADVEECLHSMFVQEDKALIVFGPGLSNKVKNGILTSYS